MLQLAAEPASAASARRAAVALAAQLGAAAETCSGVAIAVTEAVANVVVHAYRRGPAAGVEVVLRGEIGRAHV